MSSRIHSHPIPIPSRFCSCSRESRDSTSNARSATWPRRLWEVGACRRMLQGELQGLYSENSCGKPNDDPSPEMDKWVVKIPSKIERLNWVYHIIWVILAWYNPTRAPFVPTIKSLPRDHFFPRINQIPRHKLRTALINIGSARIGRAPVSQNILGNEMWNDLPTDNET